MEACAERSYPGYVALLESGELERRAVEARERLGDCTLCGQRCHADRLAAELRGATCRTAAHARVASYGVDLATEPPLRGTNGSGAVHFAGSNLRCLFTPSPHERIGDAAREMDAATLAGMMLELQARGCHNLHLVGPSHVVAQLLAAVLVAARRGLRLPLVYASNGYDNPEGLGLLDGVVDLYAPELKYGDSGAARADCRVRDYVSVSRTAVKEMHRQVGDLELAPGGLARRGLIVRHQVLPGGASHTWRVLKFVASELSPATYVHLRHGYRPVPRASRYPPLDRPPTAAEYQRAVRLAERYGLQRVDSRVAAPVA